MSVVSMKRSRLNDLVCYKNPKENVAFWWEELMDLPDVHPVKGLNNVTVRVQMNPRNRRLTYFSKFSYFYNNTKEGR